MLVCYTVARAECDLNIMDHLEKIYPHHVVDAFRREHPDAEEGGDEHVREQWGRFAGSRAGLDVLGSGERQVNPLTMTLRYAKESGETGVEEEAWGGRAHGLVRVDPHEPDWTARLERAIGAEQGHPVHLREDTPECMPLSELTPMAIGELAFADKPVLVVAGTPEEVRSAAEAAGVPVTNATVPLARAHGGAVPAMDPWHRAGEERSASLNCWWRSAAERRDRGEPIGADAGFLLAHADDRVQGVTGVTPGNLEQWAAERVASGARLAGDEEAMGQVRAAVRNGVALPVSTPTATAGATHSIGQRYGLSAPELGNPCAGARFIPTRGVNETTKCIGAKFTPVGGGGKPNPCAGARLIPFSALRPPPGASASAAKPPTIAASISHIADPAAIAKARAGVSVHMAQLPAHLAAAKAAESAAAHPRQVWVIPATNMEAAAGRSLAAGDRVGVRTNPVGEPHVELKLASGGRAVLGTPPTPVGKEVDHGHLGPDGTIVHRSCAAYYDVTHGVHVALRG